MVVVGVDKGHEDGFLSLRGAAEAPQGSTMILIAPLAGSLKVASADG